MKSISPYLTFDGNARDAMTFYHECLGGKLDIQTFGDAKAPGPPGSENLVMHATVASGSVSLMASDAMPGHPHTPGNNIHISVDCETVDEIERLFAAVSVGGNVTMPLGDMFWGARFGMLVDKFGMNWMFNCYLPKT